MADMSPFELLFPIDVNDASEKFETTSLDSVSNLSGEYGIRIEEGDDYRVSAPSNWDPDDWAMAFWFQPDWVPDDGKAYFLLQLGDADSPSIQILKNTGGALRAMVLDSGGTEYKADFSGVSWSAGDTVFFGARLSGGTLTAYFDSDDDGTLETQTASGVPSISPTGDFRIGRDETQGFVLEGAINALITDDGSSDDAIQDRFNSGNGQSLDNWLATVNDGGGGLPHAENLVLHVGGNSDGSSVQLDTFAGASQLLNDPDDGGYLFDGSSDDIDFGSYTDLDGASEALFWGEAEVDTHDGTAILVGRWSDGTNGKRQFNVNISGAGRLRFSIATDGSGGIEIYTHSTNLNHGQRFKWYVRFKGDEGTNADKVQIGLSIYNESSRSYGAWTTEQLGDASTPGTLRTPTAVNMLVGTTADGVAPFDGKIYDQRIAAASVLSISALDAQELDQAYHDEWDHWWPLEGDADDQIGSLDGTITGATSVTDGRSLSGRFERYTRQGRYNFDGVDDDISLGDWTGLDGATEFSMFGVFTLESDTVGTERVLFSRWGSAGENQFEVVVNNENIRVYLSGSGTDTNSGSGGTTINIGDRYAFWVRYKGSGASNSDRLKIALAQYDPATGTFASFSQETLTFNGTIPSSLHTPSSSHTAFFGRNSSSVYFEGKIDHWAIDPDTAQSTGDLDSVTVYDPDATIAWEHEWDMDGDANDSGDTGGVDGTVTGAQQVADGRQPVGWTLEGSGDREDDRATGSSNVDEGSYGERLKATTGSGKNLRQGPTVDQDRWLVYVGRGRKVGGNTGRLLVGSSSGEWVGSRPEDALAQNSDLQFIGLAAFHTASSQVEFLRVNANNEEVYVDDLRAYELATVSPSSATKALPTRVAFSVTNPGSGHPYVAIALNGSEQAEAWARNDSGTQFGPAGSDTTLSAGWHTIGMGYDGTDLYVVVDGVKESTAVTLSGNFDSLSETTIGAARLGVVSHFVGIGGSIEIGRIIVWDNDLTAEKRKAAHNLLKNDYPNLPDA